MYTIQIDVGTAAPLDGTTVLDINAPGVAVNKSSNRTILITLDGALVPAFGRIDPGQVVESQMPGLNGRPLVLVGFTVVSTGGPYAPAVGNDLNRITPLIGAQEATQQIVDLGDPTRQGMALGLSEIFPLDHDLGIVTVPGGPHVVILVFKDLSEIDVVKLGCCDGGGSAEPCCTPQVIGPDFPLAEGTFVPVVMPGCNIDNIVSAEVFTDPNSPPPIGLPTVLPPPVYSPGVAPAPDTLTVNLDTTGTSGSFLLAITNDCGCCTLVPFSVIPA